MIELATRTRWLVLSILSAVLFAGCRQNVDLTAIRTMASATHDAQASYDALAADYYGSCLRKAELHSIAAGMTNVTTVSAAHAVKRPAYATGSSPAELSLAPLRVLTSLPVTQLASFDGAQTLAIATRRDIVALERAFTPGQRLALSGAAAGAGDRGNVFSCSGAAKVAEQWRRRNDILVEYFVALGSLAGSGDVGDRYGVAGLAGSLEHSGAFANDDQTQAFDTLANSVLTKIFDWKRRDELAADLTQAAPLVAAMTAQLQSVAAVNYKFQLRQERDALADFRARNLRLARPGLEAFAAYRYAKMLRAEDGSLDDREAAADAYVGSLEKLREADDDVIGAFRHDDLASGVAAARSYYDGLQSDLAIVHKIVAGGGSP